MMPSCGQLQNVRRLIAAVIAKKLVVITPAGHSYSKTHKLKWAAWPTVALGIECKGARKIDADSSGKEWHESEALFLGMLNVPTYRLHEATVHLRLAVSAISDRLDPAPSTNVLNCRLVKGDILQFRE